MGKPNSSKSKTVKLAHPPGHIFWKKDPPVDKLSIYIKRVVDEQNNKDDGNDSDTDDTVSQQCNDDREESERKSNADDEQVQETSDNQHSNVGEESVKGSNRPFSQNGSQCSTKKSEKSSEKSAKETAEKVRRIIEKLYSRLFTDDLMFIKVFELPPKELTADNGLYFQQVNEKEYECKIFLKRLIDQNSCQLVFGAQSDIPPGMAVYKLSDSMTNEQRAFTKEAWGPCMDDDGYMSPGRMYPWFAMGIANCVQNIIDEESDENQSESASHSGSTKEPSDFENIEVAGEFPLIKLVIPPEKDDDDMHSTQIDEDELSIAGSVASSRKSNESKNRETKKENKQNSGGKSNEKSNTVKTKAQWYPRGPTPAGNKSGTPSPMVTPRSSKSGRPSSKTFSSFSSDVDTVNEDLEEEPVVIIIKPAIRGFGLPKGIKLQHALPKQKPFCDKGKECIKKIYDKIEDGQSMWYLQAAPVALTPQIENSARFRTTFRKIGKAVNFWCINFGPIVEIIQKNMNEVYEKHEFKIDLDQVKSCINIMKAYHSWRCISEEFINIGIMNIVKSNMSTMRSVGECTKKLLNFLHAVMASRSCPNFLQPNVNLAHGISEKEAAWVADEIKEVIDKIDEDPGNILVYIGYSKKNKD